MLRLMFSVRVGADEVAAQLDIQTSFAVINQTLDPLETNLLLHVLGYGEHSGLDPQSNQRVLVSLLRRALERWSVRMPLLIVLEDMHWVDSASSDVLAELARDVESRRCLLLTTSRPGWTPAWEAEGIGLDALGDSNAPALVDAVVVAPVDAPLPDTR